MKQYKRGDSESNNDNVKTTHINTTASSASTATLNSINDSSSSSSSSNLHANEPGNQKESHSSKLFSKNQSSINSKNSNKSSKIDTLILVVHGGKSNRRFLFAL